MNTETKTTPQALGQFRPNLCFYHANPKGTGSALKMNLHPAHDDTDGCIMVKVANQMTVGNPMGPNPTYPTFDWENALSVKLDFGDLCQMLQVLRGECESINGDKGLLHLSPAGLTRIRLSHLVDPLPGYVFEVYRSNKKDEGKDSHARYMFAPAQALGICEAVAGSLSLVAFGIPMLVPHDTSAYRSRVREVRNVAAA